MDSLSLYQSSTSSSDDDEPSSKRSKLLPHLPFAVSPTLHVLAHVYIAVNRNVSTSTFTQRLFAMARLAQTDRHPKAALADVDVLHVSLSRTARVERKQECELISAIRRAINGAKRDTLKLECRVIAFSSASAKRLFLAAPVESHCAEQVVVPLIARIDSAFEQLHLPKFHEIPLPHMSFASTDVLDVAKFYQSMHCAALDESERKEKCPVEHVPFDEVVCEIGLRRYVFPLSEP